MNGLEYLHCLLVQTTEKKNITLKDNTLRYFLISIKSFVKGYSSTIFNFEGFFNWDLIN